MSKTQLKKELQSMDAEQMRELVLDLYTARKDFKDYFEFFIDPDVEKLTEKYTLAIDKELHRQRRGYLATRFSTIRKTVKEYESYGIGADHVLRLMCHVLKTAVDNERCFYVKPAFMNGIEKTAADILKYGNKHLLFDAALAAVHEAATKASYVVRHRLHDMLEELQD